VLDLQRAVSGDVRMASRGLVVTVASDRHADPHLALAHRGPFRLMARLKNAALRYAMLNGMARA
jgi:hypothetical protein